MALKPMGIDAWFEWANAEVGKPYGLRHIMVAAAKATVKNNGSRPVFSDLSTWGRMASRYETPDLRHKIHIPAFEHLVLFGLTRMAETGTRQEAITLCEELCRLNISPRLFSNLQLLRVNAAAAKPQIMLSNAPSQSDINAFRHVAEKGEGVELKGQDLIAQRKAYGLSQGYALRHKPSHAAQAA
jgi:hypothetical protein